MKIKVLGGKGYPILLIHGWGVTGEIWASLADELKHFFKVYIVDLPGMGGSPTISPYTLSNIAKEIKANIPVKKCNVLGWSLGGQVAMHLATEEPDFVEKLILISTTPCFIEKLDWPHGVKEYFFLNFEIETKKNLNDTLMKFFLIQTRGIVNAKGIMKFLISKFIESTNSNRLGIKPALNILKKTDLRGKVKNIDKMALVIVGDKDRLTFPEASIWLSSQIKSSTLKVIKGANHMPFITHQEETIDSVMKFLLND